MYNSASLLVPPITLVGRTALSELTKQEHTNTGSSRGIRHVFGAKIVRLYPTEWVFFYDVYVFIGRCVEYRVDFLRNQ